MNKILVVDIETAPNLGYTWGKWQQNVISFKEDWYILSYAYKWLGDKKTHAKSLTSYKSYEKGSMDDKELCADLWKLFDEADIIIAHNGLSFDIKKSNARFIIHGFNPPAPYKIIDTKLEAKQYFKFDSNKLSELGKYFHVGTKLQTGGFQLWLGCMAGQKKSWKTMVEYNKQDVVLLEKVYLKLRGWIKNHPNLNILQLTNDNCPNCGKDTLKRSGIVSTRVWVYKRYQCTTCGAWCRGKRIVNKGGMVR